MVRRSHDSTGTKAYPVLLSHSENDELTNEQELISAEYVLDIYFFFFQGMLNLCKLNMLMLTYLFMRFHCTHFFLTFLQYIFII